MTVSLYLPGRSPVHRLPPAAKLAALPLAAVGLLAVDGFVPLLVVLAGVAALHALAGVPAATVAGSIRPAVVVLGAVLLAHGLLGDWAGGAVVVLRLGILLLLAALMTLTTRVSAMVDLLEQACRPLRPFGVRPARMALVVAMTIRFIPLLAGKAERIREAQRARGAERHLVVLVVPLLVAALRMADDLGDALAARGFDG